MLITFVKNAVICKQGFELENSTKVLEKGLLTLISYSEKCGKPDLHKYLNECKFILIATGIHVVLEAF